MKNLILILLILFFFLSFIESKKGKSKNKKSKHKKKNKEIKPKESFEFNEEEEFSNDEHDIDDNSDNKKKDSKIDDDEAATPEGYYMSEATFDKKLQDALDKRNLKPKKKINKEILKKLFLEIYRKTDYDEDAYIKKEGEKMSKYDSDEKMLNDVFENVGRSLDYDDKIKVSEIKDWIKPKRAQAGLMKLWIECMNIYKKNIT